MLLSICAFTNTKVCLVGLITGFGFGNHEDASFNLSEKISLNQGDNTLDILSMMIGLQASKILLLHMVS